MTKSSGLEQWTSYQSHGEINDYIKGLSSTGVNVIDIGKTYEGRIMKVLTRELIQYRESPERALFILILFN